MSQFEVKVFRNGTGYTVVLDGIGHFDAGSLADARRLAKEYLRVHVGSAFPNRPIRTPDGAKLVLRYNLELKQVR